jgi:hypothetical protein
MPRSEAALLGEMSPRRPGNNGIAVTPAVETLELLYRLTEKTDYDITLIYPEESVDYVRGFIDGLIDALRLALEHVRDTAVRR